MREAEEFWGPCTYGSVGLTWFELNFHHFNPKGLDEPIWEENSLWRGGWQWAGYVSGSERPRPVALWGPWGWTGRLKCPQLPQDFWEPRPRPQFSGTAALSAVFHVGVWVLVFSRCPCLKLFGNNLAKCGMRKLWQMGKLRLGEISECLSSTAVKRSPWVGGRPAASYFRALCGRKGSLPQRPGMGILLWLGECPSWMWPGRGLEELQPWIHLSLKWTRAVHPRSAAWSGDQGHKLWNQGWVLKLGLCPADCGMDVGMSVGVPSLSFLTWDKMCSSPSRMQWGPSETSHGVCSSAPAAWHALSWLLLSY